MLKKLMAVAALALCTFSAQAKDDKSAPASATGGRPCFQIVSDKDGQPMAVNMSRVLFMDIEEQRDNTYVLTMHVSVARYGRMPHVYFKDKASATTGLHNLVAIAAKCR